jgi:hypothetical protein
VNTRYPSSVKFVPLLSGTYYVSSSTGDDSYEGSQARPWRSIARASQFRYTGGSNILLKCEDVFTGTFVPRGTSPGFAGGTWITLGSYGTGAKPIIDGGGNTINCGVEFDRYDVADGWRIQGIKFRDQKLLGIDSERRIFTHRSGLYIDSCDFTNITGAGVMEVIDVSPTRFLNKDYDIWFSWGINTGYTDNITVTGCTFTDCDGPVNIWACNTGRITGCTVTNAMRAGISVTAFAANYYYWVSPLPPTAQGNTSIEIDNNQVNGVGSVGWIFGTAGIQTNQITAMSIHDNVVDGVQNVSHGVDMVGFDMEGGISVGSTVANNTFRNLQGAGVLMNHNGLFPINTSYSMTGCTFENICLSNPASIPWMRQNTNNAEIVSITGNTISRGVSKLFATTDTPPASPPAQWTFSGNTVTPP